MWHTGLSVRALARGRRAARPASGCAPRPSRRAAPCRSRCGCSARGTAAAGRHRPASPLATSYSRMSPAVDQTRREVAREQEAIAVLVVACADMAEGIEDALVEEDVVGVDQVVDQLWLWRACGMVSRVYGVVDAARRRYASELDVEESNDERAWRMLAPCAVGAGSGVRSAAPAQADWPREDRHGGGAVVARRRHRHLRPPARPGAHRAVEADLRGRQQAGCQRRHRRYGRGQGRTRRLHAAGGLELVARHQPGAVQDAAVRRARATSRRSRAA